METYQRRTRLELDEKLRELLGSPNVYFSPPESVKLKYPCIVYHRTGADVKNADNGVYGLHFQYTVTIIDKDPDFGKFKDPSWGQDSLVEAFLFRFPMCRYINHRTVNNLNHDTFYLYY